MTTALPAFPAQQTICSSCDRPAVACGLCMRHYQRRRRTGDLSLAPRRTAAAPPPRWPSEALNHVTSSGVAVDILDGGDVLVSVDQRGMVALDDTQWRELASYALAWVWNHDRVDNARTPANAR